MIDGLARQLDDVFDGIALSDPVIESKHHPPNPLNVQAPKGTALAPGAAIGHFGGGPMSDEDVAAALDDAVALDWLPSEVFKKQQSGLKKAVALRKKADQVQPVAPGALPPPAANMVRFDDELDAALES